MALTKEETARELRRMANLFKGLIHAADDIEAIGTLETATAEAVQAKGMAEAAKETILREVDGMRANLAAEVAAATSQAAAERAGADEYVVTTLADAKERAMAESRSIVNLAIADAASLRASASADVDRATQDLAQLQRNIDVARTELEALLIELAERRAEHTDLAEGLAGLRARIGG